MPECKICSKPYTIESTSAYESAPGWDNECTNCSRRKFEAYVRDYLLESFTVKELALRVEGYFGSARGTISGQEARDPVIDFATASVLDQGLGEGGIPSVTPRDAIAQFVEYFDKRMRHLEHILSKRAKGSVSKMCIAGGVLVGIVALIILISSYLTSIRW